MAYSSPLDNALAINPQGLDALRALNSKGQTREAVKAAASQFEAYFTQMMLRSMRQTLPKDGPFDSQETRTFTEMFDQQLAQKVSQGKGLGLADVMLAQLDKTLPADKPVQPGRSDMPAMKSSVETDAPAMGARQPDAVPVMGTVATPVIGGAAAPAGGFVDRVWPHAVDAARSLGVSPQFLVAHAALETGWGKHDIKAADGTSSNNLFNIKAGGNWDGKTVQKEVTEYVNGKPVKSMEIFRAYDSPADSFADYARLLGSNPRYAGVLNQDAEGFVRGLQQGGFATDPAYADKLKRVIGSAALRAEMAG